MFTTNFVKLLISLFLSLHLISCFQNEYRKGYNDGFRDARRESRNRFRHRLRSPQKFINHRQEEFPTYESPDYEPQNSGFDEEYEDRIEESNFREGRRKPGAANYGNIFAVDENVLSRGLTAMTGQCRELIKPEFGTCIERAANKFDINVEKETVLGENDCKALWDLMCCSTQLISKKCRAVDLKAIQMGFFTIQKVLEMKGCTDTPRSSVQCSDNASNKT